MDQFLKNRFDKILSLGSNCYPKIFIQKYIKPPYGETELFDYIGTSMRSINELILNDFEDITRNKYISLLPIIAGENPIITNTKYYIRFKHDLKKFEELHTTDFKSKIQRRILRFKCNMMRSNNILFIRHQETMTNRILYNSVLRSELEEMRDFIDILRMTYGTKNITILYINLEKDGWNHEHDIFSVKIQSLDYDWKKCHDVIYKLFEEKCVIDNLK